MGEPAPCRFCQFGAAFGEGAGTFDAVLAGQIGLGLVGLIVAECVKQYYYIDKYRKK
jgi:hypothetical protein